MAVAVVAVPEVPVVCRRREVAPRVEEREPVARALALHRGEAALAVCWESCKLSRRGRSSSPITQGDPEVTIENANGVASTVYADGRTQESKAEDGGTTKVKSRWKKNKLAVNVSFPGSGGTTPTLTQTYSLTKDGRLLVNSTVGIGGGMRPFTVKRLYDRQE